jgi:heterodisulfide reductase subunit B
MAIALPARNLGIADAMGMEEVVIPCSACYSRMLIAYERLGSDPDLLADINGGLEKKVTRKTKIISILKVINRTIESGALRNINKSRLKGLKPVCYYGCLQTRFPVDVVPEDDIENPQSMEKILRFLGLKPLDWNYKTACCGASASVNDKKLSMGLMAKIMKDAVSRGANCFITSCPMCQLNLDSYQEEVCETHGIESRLPVFFITEILGIVLGFSAEEMLIDRHFVDPDGLLREAQTA